MVDRAALLKMHPAASPEVAPLRRVACAVIGQAVADLHNPALPARVRAQARGFVQSPNFTTWCGLTGINPAAARSKLLVLTLGDDPQNPADLEQ